MNLEEIRNAIEEFDEEEKRTFFSETARIMIRRNMETCGEKRLEGIGLKEAA